ncbi:hypothetical protein [Streptomyces sp. NPDC056144]|uniref:hypothetical protein n=1 Tax=unclassified Streptomyces TaxID=2593676 RepID=UPI0035DC6B33
MRVIQAGKAAWVRNRPLLKLLDEIGQAVGCGLVLASSFVAQLVPAPWMWLFRLGFAVFLLGALRAIPGAWRAWRQDRAERAQQIT